MLARPALGPGLALVLASACASAAEPGPPSDPGGDVRSALIRLDDDLGVSDIRLAQARESRRVTFSRGARWEAAEGSRRGLAVAGPAQRAVLDLTGTTPEAVLRAAWGVISSSAEM
ncbi:MAG TPA: hypothetical protein VLI67_00510, partial [Vicinamibacteria bacterium]|nr:hypothetical protein [Vicinamibacteria bacterium]